MNHPRFGPQVPVSSRSFFKLFPQSQKDHEELGLVGSRPCPMSCQRCLWRNHSLCVGGEEYKHIELFTR